MLSSRQPHQGDWEDTADTEGWVQGRTWILFPHFWLSPCQEIQNSRKWRFTTAVRIRDSLINFLFWILSLIQQILIVYQLLNTMMVLGTAINKSQDSHPQELTVSRDTPSKGKVCNIMSMCNMDTWSKGRRSQRDGALPSIKYHLLLVLTPQ